MASKLLLADDSVTIQKVVELILTEEGFEIKTTNNGEEALSLIPSFMPDVILADIEMPKLNGYQLCEKIKQDPSMRDVPVILLAGAFEPINKKLAQQVKADDFIIKPFESQELINKIRAALESPHISGSEKGNGTDETFRSDEITEEELWSMEMDDITGIPQPKKWGVEEKSELGREQAAKMSEQAEVDAESLSEDTILSMVENDIGQEVSVEMPHFELPSSDDLKEIFEKAVQERIASLTSSVDIKETIITTLTPFIKDSVERMAEEVAPDFVKELLEKSIHEKISSSFATLDVKEVFLESLTPFVKDFIQEMIRGVTPDILERMLREELKGSLESLTRETQKVMGDTIPDLVTGALKDMMTESFSLLKPEVEKAIWKTVPDLAEQLISKEIERIRSEF
ncbi:MAG: response regulator [Nitrospira sp.]|nr:response regulator [Nitrospira sp.]